MKNPGIKYWVLVANSGQARILELQQKPYACHQVTELVSKTQHLTNKELVSDASGRIRRSQGAGMHSMTPRSDPHENAEEAFTRGVAGTLGKAAGLGRFDRLLIMADPKTLGRLRRQMDHAVSERVADELSLDLVRLPLPQLETRVREALGWAA